MSISKTNLKGLTSDEVCTILKCCREAGVSTLKFGPLAVEFGQPQPKQEQLISPPELVATQETEDKKARVLEDLKSRQLELEELYITDPALAEELVASGAVEDEDGTESEAYE